MIGFIVVAFFVHTHSFFEKKFEVVTGEAQWLWVKNQMSLEKPAAFFATREFEVPPSASIVRINIAADPAYTLWFNGQLVGADSMYREAKIHSYDVTAMKRAGKNRIVVALRSEKGAGGLLASVDFGAMARNLVVSASDWKIYPWWKPELLQRDLPGSDHSARTFGPPPTGRWNFLQRVDAKVETKQGPDLAPSSVDDFTGRVPETRILSGIAVASARPVPARAFDFGHVRGRVRIRRESSGGIQVVRVRFANTRDEWTAEGSTSPIVFAPDEESVLDPEVREFRYVIVFGATGEVTVAPVE